MKITKIRWNDENLGKYGLTLRLLDSLCVEIHTELTKKGFLTNVRLNENGSINIGLGMCSFRIDATKLGHNADTSWTAKQTCKKGYRRTTIPTWEEREEFNHTINDVLDKWKLRANARNSLVSIRSFAWGRVNSWDMERFGRGERFYYEITKEKGLLKEVV